MATRFLEECCQPRSRLIHTYLEGGLHEDTLIELEDGRSAKIKDVEVNDILYKDSQGQVLGNTFLQCLKDPEGIKPGSYGECKVVLQRVDGKFLDTFGTDKWTEIVNTQLSYLNDIQYCDLLGFSY